MQCLLNIPRIRKPRCHPEDAARCRAEARRLRCQKSFWKEPEASGTRPAPMEVDRRTPEYENCVTAVERGLRVHHAHEEKPRPLPPSRYINHWALYTQGPLWLARSESVKHLAGQVQRWHVREPSRKDNKQTSTTTTRSLECVQCEALWTFSLMFQSLCMCEINKWALNVQVKLIKRGSPAPIQHGSLF